jgi:hypothetical protein
MGRPLQKKYFGNRNPGSPTNTADDYGIGGQFVSSIAVGNATGYSQGTTVSIGSPDLPTGVQATATVSIFTANGNISSFTFTEAGSGYTSAPAVTLVKTANVIANVTGTSGANVLSMTSTAGIFVGMQVTGNVGLGGVGDTSTVVTVNAANVIVADNHDDDITGNVTFFDAGTGVAGTVTLGSFATDVSNAVTFSSNIASDTSSADIIRQISTKAFLIQTNNGNVGRANLVTVDSGNLTSGQMSITATDSASGTYFVKKITGHIATVVPGTGTQFTANSRVQWTLGAAVANVSVSIPSV